MIDITGRDKAEVLRALYNKAKPQGLGMLDFASHNMDIEEARELADRSLSYDYLHGRVMKIDLSSDKFYSGLYDRDNGEGAARDAIDNI